MKTAFFSAAALAFALSFSNAASAQNAAGDSVKTAVIKVTNLHCNGDMPTIKENLLNQEGVDDVSFTDRDNGMSTFTIQYHSSVSDQTKLEKTIESTPGCDDKSETPYRVKREKGSKKKRS